MGNTGYWDTIKDAMSENREIVRQNIDESKAMRESNGEPVGFMDRIKNIQLFHYASSYDDMIEVKSGTMTLLGDDFSSLYESSAVEKVQAQNINGQVVPLDVIRSTSSYQTEMHSGNLRRALWSEYDMLPEDTKAAYEVTLLTKKFAVMPESEENAAAYANAMAMYRQYCDAHDISWNTVICNVSAELQTEVADYKKAMDDKSSIYSQVGRSADKARAQAADAHNLLLSCAPDGYDDILLPALEGSVTYEDTCDASYDGSVIAHTAGFFAVVHNAFSVIYDKLPHPISWAKSVFNNLKNEGTAFVENTKGLMDDFEVQHEARMKEYEEIADQMQGVRDDIDSTQAGQAINQAGDSISDEIQQIFEDPSQEIQDARDWMKENAAPYFDAFGNALDAAGDALKERSDEFIDKWATPEEDPLMDQEESYQP